MKSYTPGEAARALQGFEKELTKEHVKALRRVLGRLKTKAVNAFASRGVGRRIFARDKSGLRKQIKRQRVKVLNNGQTMTSGFDVVGLTALQEAGGLTKPHMIRPKRGHLMAFQARGGGLVFTRFVHHPGSRMKAMHVVKGIVDASGPDLQREFDTTTQATANRIVG